VVPLARCQRSRRFSSRCSGQLWSGPRRPQPTIETNDADEDLLVIDGAERRQWIKGGADCLGLGE
jgi:hypothetical protein